MTALRLDERQPGAAVRLAQGWRRFVDGVRAFFKVLYETPPGC
jgi:hypothetical protein